MPEAPNMNDTTRFFLTGGRKILTASLIAFYHQGMDFTEICQKIMENSFQNLFTEIDNTFNDSAIMYINSFQGTNDVNTSGCKQSTDDALKLFATNAKIKNSLHRPVENQLTIEPKMIENYNIFVIVEDAKLELYAPLLNIIVSQFMQYISERKVNDKSKNILLFLDEYASLHIDSETVLEALRKYRKRKCRIMIMTQNLADLDILYGHEVTRALLANMRFKVLLGGLGEQESQKYFADLIGYRKAKKSSKTTSVKNTSVTESEAKEYIIEPSDLDRIGDDLILISPDGEGWLRLHKNFYYISDSKKRKKK
jgi:type IV secretory pathway TraG/TraD family ATPase VirD4